MLFSKSKLSDYCRIVIAEMSAIRFPKDASDQFPHRFPVIVIVLFPLDCIDATRDRSIGMNRHNHHRNREYQSHNHEPAYSSSNGEYNTFGSYNGIFDVLSFGAKGDGISDDSKALLAAWAAACGIGSATIEIPSEFHFPVGPITLQGPCKPGLVLQIDGTILAPGELRSWPRSGLLRWLNFQNLQGLVIQGRGTVDGQGSAWWAIPELQLNLEAVRFYSSYNVTVRDIQIQNSPLCHLKFDNCTGVNVSNLTISSPGDSPNTHGIHLQNSQAIEVQYSSISCGDDCVSIQTGCSNVYIHHTKCGPGHGIGMGGLGKDGSLACVRDIRVQDNTMQETLCGVKTWQGGIGSIKSVSFSNIEVSNVKVPVVIDQFYCNNQACENKTDAMAISNISFYQINGTYSMRAIYLACSNSIPCTNISMGDITLAPSAYALALKPALCWNSYGKSQGPPLPTTIDCLETNNPYKNSKSLIKTNLTC